MSMKELQERYAAALGRLVEQAEEDPTLIGLYVYGSSIRGDIWKGSDIDAVFVTSDERKAWEAYALLEDGIHVSVEVCSRSHFRTLHERSLRGSALHSIFASGKLLYTSEPTLHEYLDEAREVGQRDLDLLRFRVAIDILGFLHLSEKALAFRGDVTTGYWAIAQACERKARLAVLDRGEPLCRDIIARARDVDPDYAHLWSQVISSCEDIPALLKTHGHMLDELQQKARSLFRPLLSFLEEEREVRTASEIQRALGNRIGMPDVAHGVGMACEVLVDWGILQRSTSPLRLTRRGRVEFQEAAFFFEGQLGGKG